MRGDKQRRKERDGGERRGEVFFFLRPRRLCRQSEDVLCFLVCLWRTFLWSVQQPLLKHAPPHLPHPALWRPLTWAASRDTSDPTLGDDGHRSALIEFSACVQTHVKMLCVMVKTGDAPVNLFFVKSSPGSGKMWGTLHPQKQNLDKHLKFRKKGKKSLYCDFVGLLLSLHTQWNYGMMRNNFKWSIEF